MSRVLNFNDIQKSYLTVTLNDEKQTSLMIGTPTKRVMDNLMLLQETFKGVNEGAEVESGVMDDLYNACAQIMSNNKTRTRIDADKLADLFDFEDIFLFFNTYMEFVAAVTNSKN